MCRRLICGCRCSVGELLPGGSVSVNALDGDGVVGCQVNGDGTGGVVIGIAVSNHVRMVGFLVCCPKQLEPFGRVPDY